MTFLVRDDDDAGIELSKEMGFTIIGLIGSLFMAEHGWMIDFANQEVIIPDSDVSAIELRDIKGKQIVG